MQKQKKGFYTFWILIGVLVLAFFLRINHLNDTSLWLDEGITYYNSSAENFEGVWDKVARLDQSPPGYYLLMHGYLEIFGENEFGFRLISVVFSLLSIVFLYLLLSKLINRETAVFAAFLLAINPFHIGFSMEARMYVLLSLESLMGFYFLYKAMKQEKRLISFFWWILFTLSSIFGIYTHNFYVFILLAFFFIFFIFLFGLEIENKLAKFFSGFLSALFVVLAYIPWLSNFQKQMGVDRYWMAPNSLSDIKYYFLDFSNGNNLILWIFIVLAIIGLLWSFISKRPIIYEKRRFMTVALVLFVVISLGVPLLYSRTFEPILKIRYVVYVVPIWMSIVAMGLYFLRRYSIVYPLILLIITSYLFAPWEVSAYPLEFGEDFRGLVETVEKDSDPIVVHTPSIAHVINFYNENKLNVNPFPYSDDLNEYNIDETFENKFKDLVKDFDSFYLVISHTHENPHGLLEVWSNSICHTVSEIEIQGMRVWRFEKCNL